MRTFDTGSDLMKWHSNIAVNSPGRTPLRQQASQQYYVCRSCSPRHYNNLGRDLLSGSNPFPDLYSVFKLSSFCVPTANAWGGQLGPLKPAVVCLVLL